MSNAHTPTSGVSRRLRRAATALATATLTCAALMLSAPAALAFEGQPDPTFGTNGQARWPVGLADPEHEVYAPAIGNPAETAALSGDNFAQFHLFHLEIFSADGRSMVANSLSSGSPDVTSPVALVPMPDGHYMAVGATISDGSNQIVLARFNGDGSADVSFGLQVVPETQCPESPVGPGNGNIPFAAAATPGGNLLVVGDCGETSTAPAGRVAVWRFNEQGKLNDTTTLGTFTTNGVPITFRSLTSFTPTAITVTGTGATDYVTGSFDGTLTTGQSVFRSFLAKYEITSGGFSQFASGFGDDTGSLNGSHYAVLGSGNPAFPDLLANAVTTDANGNVLIAGTAQASPPATGAAFAVARFLPDGLPDQAFGAGDQREIPITSNQAGAGAEAVAVRSDGKIWLSGHVFNDAGVDGIAVVRLGPGGQDDDTFGLNDNSQQVYGVPSGQFVNDGGAMFLQPNGFPVIAEDGGSLSGGGEEFVLERITSAVCTLCGTTTAQPTSGGFVIASDHGPGGPSMGILVQRLVHGKPVTVGRVPFGPQRLGHVRLHWNLKVAGRRLKPGKYLVTVRALDKHGHVVALSNPIRLTIRRSRR